MKTALVICLTFLALGARADERKFSAADVPKARIRSTGKIVIANDRSHITTFRFIGNIRESLISLRSTRSLVMRPYGAAIFNSSASLTQPLPPYISAIIADAARAHGLDPRLVAAVANRESGWDAKAVSSVGASGLMQLMPQTARFLGVVDVFDARQNVFAGAHYLRTLLDAFNGDLDLALAAYNAGPGAVQKYNGVPPYRETRAYVAAVRASYEKASR
ncbi:MAG TPA: lytic transglycosylase domain-containing protein [Thermoanaerobaculia bacterium]|nr:lytic transglycosylase domain-containing protein [Thermoanaerobaculia bacterium]